MKKSSKRSEMEYIEKNQKKEILQQEIKKSWEVIAPFWPLENLIAVNPLRGLENLPIEEAILQSSVYFEQEDLPEPMSEINRLTIKWMQAFFDNGQASINMPLRKQGLYSSLKQLMNFDEQLHYNDIEKTEWLYFLPKSSEQAIAECLLRLSIQKEDRSLFMTLMLTTLAGWASHVKYLNNWQEIDHTKPSTEADYLAIRLIITCLIWPKANDLLDWHKQILSKTSKKANPLLKIIKAENNYRLPLLKQIASQSLTENHRYEAQLVFCIDVRSEPFRRSIEAFGNYETFGFAGFFGIPVEIENEVTGEKYASCPVLLKPKHKVSDSCLKNKEKHARLINIKSFYQSLKYNFTTPFALVETIGIWSGAWMMIRSFLPSFASRLKDNIINMINPTHQQKPNLDNISFEEKCFYGESALKLMGLTQNFAPLVILCGHGSTTLNNAFATALDCGACGGRQGASNARIMAEILNDRFLRKKLEEKQIFIPDDTIFVAAQHNTTTDEVCFYNQEDIIGLNIIKKDLESARHQNNLWRCKQMQYDGKTPSIHTSKRSHDWAQVRPEWGLARNASFIIAPRELTKNINLQGRSFLHSYDYKQDAQGDALTVILTAPMVAAQWINSQYLFSTLNNVAYGAGNKITKNITGKFGIMQGNASDLMTGLPLQSVYESDTQAYHEMQRLMTVVYATRSVVDKIIAKQELLQKLFGNGWVTLACIEAEDNQTYFLQRDLTWQKPL